MEIVSSLLSSCIVLHNEQLFVIPDTLEIDKETYESLKGTIKLRPIKENNGKYKLKISDTQTIVNKSKNLSEYKEITDYYETTKSKLYRNEFGIYERDIIINNKIMSINDVLKQKLCVYQKSEEIKISRIIGLGTESAAFIGKSNAKEYIIKLPLYAPLDAYLCNLAISSYDTGLSEDNDPKKRREANHDAILQLAQAIAKEKSQINQKCGIKTKPLDGGGTMEQKIQGKTLTELIEGQPNISIFKFKIFILTIIELQKLHKKGIYHNDVHSDNIIVDGNQVKLIDFGLTQIRKRKIQLSECVSKQKHQTKVSKKNNIYTFEPEETSKDSDDQDWANLIKLCDELGFDKEEFEWILEDYAKQPKILLHNLSYELAQQILTTLGQKYQSEQKVIIDMIEENNARCFWKNFSHKVRNIKDVNLKADLKALLQIHKSINEATKTYLMINAECLLSTSCCMILLQLIVNVILYSCAPLFAIKYSDASIYINATILILLIASIVSSASIIYIEEKNYKTLSQSGELSDRGSSVYLSTDYFNPSDQNENSTLMN